MLPTTFQALVVLVLAVAPGYIAIVTWARAKTWKGFSSDLDTVLRSLVVSALIQVPMAPLAVWFGLYPDLAQVGRRAWLLFIWLLLTVILLPLLGSAIASSSYDRFLLPLARSDNPSHNEKIRAPRPPSPWDRFFLQKVPNGSWLVLELEGGYVAGSWERGSYAITSPLQHGLYLQRQ
ncbi:MAG: DUF6338 family protein [Chloroflexota bacterium]|nr:MAG: hypothetical protein DLM70_19460 [Chloroflexota bacterium]